MVWKFDNDRMIYIQIVEQFKLMIVSGVYEKGARVEPVRDLSAQAGVNPNTMQKALSELERVGLMTTNRTSGRYITDDEEIIRAAKKEICEQKLSVFLADMQKLGYEKKEVIDLLTDYNQEVER